MKHYLVLPALVAAVVLMFSASAQAQATRTWVSGVGDDMAVCSRTAPCKTFARALTQTAAAGEINCLDPGGFGSVAITKSITINCEGNVGGILADSSSTVGIVINAASTDIVTLRGLDLDGNRIGSRGIVFSTGAALHIQNCSIRNWASSFGTGISFVPSGSAVLDVSDTAITDNGSMASNLGHFGIHVVPIPGGNAKVVLDRVTISNNFGGFRAQSVSTAIPIDVTITNSTIASSVANGVVANSVGQGAVQVMVNNTSISNNGAAGIRADGNNATIRLRNSIVTGNTTGANITNSAALRSYGNNSINGNGSSGSAPTTIPLQ